MVHLVINISEMTHILNVYPLRAGPGYKLDITTTSRQYLKLHTQTRTHISIHKSIGLVFLVLLIVKLIIVTKLLQKTIAVHC